jgi:lysyl-tRNA synthetase class 2
MPSRQTAIRANLQLRARLTAAVRDFFAARDYLDVETPLRLPAPAPEAHIVPVESQSWFLQTSPELAMKRLLAAGYPRIFQICRCFRGAERGTRHLPEFTLLEWYTAGEDYRHMMTQTEDLVRAVAQALGCGRTLRFQNRCIDLSPPWERLCVAEAFARYASCSVTRALKEERFDEVMAFEIEHHLGWQRPTLLCDYPAACAALARLKPEQPDVAERFELYIAGLELCNGFSELTDAGEQRRRFEAVRQAQRAAGQAASPMPEAFLAALPQMPPAAGNALGLDRLAMLFADTLTIEDVTAFTPEEL